MGTVSAAHREKKEMPQIWTKGKELMSKVGRRMGDRMGRRGQAQDALGASVSAIVESLESRQLLSVPNGPFGSAAAPTGAGVNVTWYDNSWDETGFRVERRTAGGTYATVATLGVNATSFSDTSVSVGGQYQYRIRAFSAGGDSGTTETNIVTATSGGGFTGGTAGGSATTVPNGPWSTVATATSATSARITWTSNSNNESGFRILRKTWSGNYSVVGTVGAGVTSWNDTSLSGSTTYTYQIQAYNNVGSSGLSNEGSVTTPAGGGTTTPPPTTVPGNATTVPNGPWGLVTSAGSANSVSLKWSAVSGNESGFRIERKTWSGNYAAVGTVGAGVTYWTDSSVSGSTQYTYRVVAYNNVGDSSYTNESVVSTPAGGGGTTSPGPVPGNATTVPNGPWSLAGSASGSGINLTWADNANNESGFKIERKTPGGSYSQVGTVGAGVTNWTDTAAGVGNTYTYRVKAYNNIGDSAYSNEATVTSSGSGTGGGTGGGSSTWSSAETSGYFTIGIYRQPTTSFGTWKSRGVNTAVDFYDRQDWMTAWIASAHQYGFMEIRNPQANIAADKSDPNLLAYEHSDEPDVNGIPLSTLQAEYAQWKAGNPNVPVLINVAGATVIGQLDQTTDQDYKNMFATADWVSNDVYPISAWGQNSWIDKTQANGNPWGIPDKLNEANAVDKIRQLTGGSKRQFAYVETSWQRLNQVNSGSSRQPTAAEVRGEIWNDVIHGAKGIIYFPQAFNPDTTDATPPDVAAELTNTDAKLTSFAKALNNLSDSQSNFVDLGGGLEGTYRDYNGHRYWFVLNFSHSSTYQSFTLPGLGTGNVEVAGEGRYTWANNGAVTDSFGAYDVHVYRV